MTKFSLRRLALTGLATAAFCTTPAWAAQAYGGAHHDDGQMIDHLVAELDLTATQEEEIKALHQAAARENEADRQQLRVLRERLHEQMDDFDAGEAQRLADQMGEITTRLAYSMASTRAAMRSLLTEQQRQQLTELMAAHKKRGRRHGDHERQRRADSDDLPPAR